MELFIFKYTLVSKLADANIASGNGKPLKLARDSSYRMGFQVKISVDC